MNTSTSRTLARRWAVALLVAAVTTALAWLIAGVSFFIAAQQQTSMLLNALNYFAPAAWILLVLLTVVNGVGITRRPLLSSYAGALAAVISSLASTAVQTSQANPGSDVSSYVWGSIVGINLVFILAVILLQGLLAPRLIERFGAPWRRQKSGRKIALVRIPASNLADGELTHLARRPVNTELADEQWDNYCAALTAEGWQLVEVDAAPELADSVFVEDMVVFFGSLAVLTSPGAESRAAELDAVERAVRALPGVRVEQLKKPGTLDGGDVLIVGETVYVGASSRTNGEGIRQLRAIVEPEGYHVVGVPVERVLHLKSAATALPDGTVIGDPKLIDPALFERFLAVPEAEGAAVVQLSDDTLLISAAAPKTAQLIANLGYRVIAVDVSEFEKLEGCVTCLSVRIQ